MTEEKTPPPAALASPPRSLWTRAAWTVVPLIAALLGQRVLLPGVDGGAFPATKESMASYSVAALGVMPFISASVLVELVALMVPSWSRRRHGGIEGRRSLDHAATLLGIALAGFQAFGMARLLSSFEMARVSVPIVTVTLVGASAGLFLLAEVASARGLASGMGVLMAALPLAVLPYSTAEEFDEPFTALRVATTVGAALAIALATWYALERRVAAPGAVEAPSTYRSPAPGPAATPVSVPVPASGIGPLFLAAWLVRISWMFARRAPDLAGIPLTALTLVLLLGAGVLASWLFNLPARVAAVTRRARASADSPAPIAEARVSLWRATMETLVYLAALLTVSTLHERVFHVAFSATAIALATALALDLAAEWRARRAFPDLVPVWPEHRPYAVGPAREALAEAGIPLHARGERLRRLLQIGGPYVPIDLMVPQKDAAPAAQILDRVLRARADEEAPAAAGAPLPPAAKAPAKPPILAAALLGFLSCALLGSTFVSRPPPGPRTVAMALLAVDDDQEIVDPSGAAALGALPRGMSVDLENAPLGPDRTALRHYLRLVRAENESLEAARARLMAWVKAHPIPAGDRVFVGEVTEYDEEKEALEVVGWRTWLVKGLPVVTELDVVDAFANRPARGSTTLASATISLQLGPEGAQRFDDFTAANVKRRMAIVVDGKVASAPVILSRIPGGHAQITMGAGDPEQQLAEAKRLARGIAGR